MTLSVFIYLIRHQQAQDWPTGRQANSNNTLLVRFPRLPGVGRLTASRRVVVAPIRALGTLHFMAGESQFRVAITSSLELVERGEHAEALKLLDESIAAAKREHDVPLIRTLCHHAAIVSRFTENLASAQHYYEESLAADPENARALYGLATIAFDQGELETAKLYATRCHSAILRCDDDEVLKQGLLDLLAKHWPDIAENPG